eukprot:evm.model.NODE_4438_length_26530_cov_22.454391.5
MATDGLPRLRLVSLAEVDDLAKLNEPVEPLARDQAMEIINDIKGAMPQEVDTPSPPPC